MNKHAWKHMARLLITYGETLVLMEIPSWVQNWVGGCTLAIHSSTSGIKFRW